MLFWRVAQEVKVESNNINTAIASILTGKFPVSIVL